MVQVAVSIGNFIVLVAQRGFKLGAPPDRTNKLLDLSRLRSFYFGQSFFNKKIFCRPDNQ